MTVTNLNQERRTHVRFEHISPVCIKDDKIGNLFKGRMLDFCTNGLYFEADSFIEPGTVIHIALKISPLEIETSDYDCYRAIIIWRDMAEHSHFSYGYGIKLFSLNYEIILGATEFLYQEEQRKFRRSKVDIPINFRVRDKLLTGYSKDISKSGAFIKSSADLNVGENLYLSIPAINGKLYSLSGKIMWANQEGFGVKFIK